MVNRPSRNAVDDAWQSHRDADDSGGCVDKALTWSELEGRTMGCLLTLGAFGGGLATGLLVRGTLNALTGNQQLASAVGTGIWFMSSLLFLM